MKSALAAAASLFVLAGPVAAEDLLKVYEDALANDPLIREANANRLAVREARPQAWAALLPQINSVLMTSRNPSEAIEPVFQRGDDPNDPVAIFTVPTDTDRDTEGYTLELRQSVFSWQNWMALRRAGHEVAQAEVDYRAAEQDLIVRVAQRYFDVLAARDNLEAEQTALEAISRQLEQAEKRFEVGLIAITDVQEARAARDSAAAAVIASKRALATAEELLREITNMQYERLAKPAEDMPLRTPKPADQERWVEAAMNQNLALISSRLAADIARENVRVARGGHFPSIELVASRSDFTSDVDTTITGTNQRGVFTTESTDDSIELRLSIPLFTGGLTQSQVRESQYRWIAAKERVVRVSRETERAARDAYLGVISEIARVKALRQALESSQTALKATEAGYEVGTRTAVDVLDARRTLVQAQTNYARSRYDYLLNVIRLRQAAGDLDRATLAEINEWLNVVVPLRPSLTEIPLPEGEQSEGEESGTAQPEP